MPHCSFVSFLKLNIEFNVQNVQIWESCKISEHFSSLKFLPFHERDGKKVFFLENLGPKKLFRDDYVR